MGLVDVPCSRGIITEFKLCKCPLEMYLAQTKIVEGGIFRAFFESIQPAIFVVFQVVIYLSFFTDHHGKEINIILEIAGDKIAWVCFSFKCDQGTGFYKPEGKDRIVSMSAVVVKIELKLRL